MIDEGETFQTGARGVRYNPALLHDPSKAYRPDIDGLRAVAVLAVLAFHIAPERVPGGFVGVDIFFVISGYLITGIVLRGLASGDFTFAGFYRRRVRRIFPALIVVLASIAVLAVLLLVAGDLERFGFQLAAGSVSAANFVFWAEGGYFDLRPYTKPLLHLWSLAVEEQFYLFWPLALVLAWKIGRARGAAVATALLLAASFGFSLWSTEARPIAAFYSPVSRIWELLAGGLLAFGHRRTLPPLAANLCSAGGLVAIAAALAVIHPNSRFPGWLALLPVMGALLLILAGPSAWINRHLLVRRPAVWIGLISYPLYLWHWPLLSIASFLNLEELGARRGAAIGLVSIGLASLTYIFVEQPVRRGGRVSTVKLVGAMVALFGVGVFLWRADGLPGRRIPDQERREFLTDYRLGHRERFKEEFQQTCGFGSPATPRAEDSLPPQCVAAGARGTWFLWGDSLAHAIGTGLRLELPPAVSLAQVSTGGCRPAMPGEDAFSQRSALCRKSDAYAARQIARLAPEVVIFVQWGGYHLVDWEARAARLHALGVRRVMVMGPLPRWSSPLPQIVAKHYWPAIPPFIKKGLAPEQLWTEEVTSKALRNSSSVEYLSMFDALCRPEGCRATVPGGAPRELMVFDGSYLTLGGSRYVARTILVPRLSQSLRQFAAR